MNKDDFFAAIDRISSFAIINLLWVAISVFIITLPAATAGLFAVCCDWVQGKESETFERFFAAMRRHAGRATLLVLADNLGLGLVALNLMILPKMGLPVVMFWPFVAITSFVGLLILVANLYLWPLLVGYEIPLQALTRIAISLVFHHMRWSLFLLAMCAFALSSGLLLLPKGLIVLVLFSACALLNSWGAWRVIQHYDSELQLIQAETFLPQ